MIKFCNIIIESFTYAYILQRIGILDVFQEPFFHEMKYMIGLWLVWFGVVWYHACEFIHNETPKNQTVWLSNIIFNKLIKKHQKEVRNENY